MTRRIRIVHVVESFGGGVFEMIAMVLNHLDPEKYDIWLIYSLRPETPPDFKAMIHSNVNLVNLPMQREVSLLKDFRDLLALRQEMLRIRPDIIHLHSSKAGVLGRIAARACGIKPVFYSPHGFSFLRRDIGAGRRAFFIAMEKGSSLFGGTLIACSRGELEAARPIANRSVQIDNAVDSEAIDRTVADIPQRAGRPLTIATLGRISAQKSPALFGSLAHAVTRLRPGKVRFIWIGGGEEEAQLAGCPVEILGWQTREAALRILRAEVDIYLQVSRWEGMPLAILEAMALGLPVVATDVVGNRDAVTDGVTGRVTSDPTALLDALLSMIDHEEERQAMGRAGREKVARDFSISKYIERLEAQYALGLGTLGACASPGG